MDAEVQFGKMEMFWRWRWWQLHMNALNVTEPDTEMVKMVNLMLCVFYHNVYVLRCISPASHPRLRTPGPGFSLLSLCPFSYVFIFLNRNLSGPMGTYPETLWWPWEHNLHCRNRTCHSTPGTWMVFYLHCPVGDRILGPASVGHKFINMEVRLAPRKLVLLRILHFRN